MTKFLSLAVVVTLFTAPMATAAEASANGTYTGSYSGSRAAGSVEGDGFRFLGNSSAPLSSLGSSYSPDIKASNLKEKGYNQDAAEAIAWGSMSEEGMKRCNPNWGKSADEPQTEVYYTCPSHPISFLDWISSLFHHIKVMLGLAEPGAK